MTENESAVHLFWTGGWDSTFRLIWLLTRLKKPVQPHYLIDTGRHSIGAELYSMRNIKQRIFSRFPETASLLCNTIFYSVSDVPAKPAVTEALERIRRRYDHIGTQYDWLARYCIETGLHDVELGITLDGTPHKILDALVTSSGEGIDRVYWVDHKHQDLDEHLIFGNFRFPIFNMTKKEMENIAREEGLLDIMGLTWFCHDPRPNYQPCGLCGPCSFTIQEGLGWRLPRTSKLRYYTSPRLQLQRYPKLYSVYARFKNRLQH